jgi:pimeloyl-ACP methyl ester carboxylesterase
MAPRYHSAKSVKGSGYNKYNGDKGYNKDSYNDHESIPLIVNPDFHYQYKRNMDLVGPGGVRPEYVITAYNTPKPKLSIDEFHKQNENGLRKAYNSPNYLYQDNDTLYIAGTKTSRDLYDDIKIPFGLTRYSQRYQDADKVLQQDPNIKNLVGHSLGGAASLEFEKKHPERHYNTTTYSAPVASMNSSDSRFRKYGDRISSLDWGAQSVARFDPTVSQHSYAGYS